MHSFAAPYPFPYHSMSLHSCAHTTKSPFQVMSTYALAMDDENEVGDDIDDDENGFA